MSKRERIPHTASFLQTFHTGRTAAQRYRAETDEAEALAFVSGGTRPVALTMEVTSWSGTTIEVPDAPEFASAAQVKWMMNIAERKQLPAGATAESLFVRLRQGFAKFPASQFITKYKDLPDLPRELTAAEKTAGAEAIAPTAETAEVSPQVEDGRYAVEEDGVLKFFKVKNGRKPGFVFLSVQASDDWFDIRRADRRNAVLALIAANPLAATIRYGHELGQCGRCGRTLTDEASRYAGIGPVCLSKM